MDDPVSGGFTAIYRDAKLEVAVAGVHRLVDGIMTFVGTEEASQWGARASRAEFDPLRPVSGMHGATVADSDKRQTINAALREDSIGPNKPMLPTAHAAAAVQPPRPLRWHTGQPSCCTGARHG